MISILRGSFDILLPCVMDAAGRCDLPLPVSSRPPTLLVHVIVLGTVSSLQASSSL